VEKEQKIALYLRKKGKGKGEREDSNHQRFRSDKREKRPPRRPPQGNGGHGRTGVRSGANSTEMVYNGTARLRLEEGARNMGGREQEMNFRVRLLSVAEKAETLL